MRFHIIRPSKLRGEIEALYKAGLPRGVSTGWPSVDAHYTVAPQQWTVVTGVPNSGKSEWLDGLLVNLARSGWRHVIFSPENQPLQLHISKLLEKIVGKPFGDGPNERMTEAERQKGEAWMDKRFRFILPQGLEASITPHEVIEAMQMQIADIRTLEPEAPIGAVIDPWNEMEHNLPMGQSLTQYISQTLTYFRQFARTFNVHLWIVAHPFKLQKDKEGKRPVPTPYDISDSAHWYNKADNCITVHRNQVEGSADVDIHVQKVRFKNIGKIGVVTLRWDRVTGQYRELPYVIQQRAADYKMRSAGE